TTAMRENRRLSITYQNYEMQTAREFEIEPYALRYFGRRWYVLAHTDFHSSPYLYALDRMKAVNITESTFKLPKDFSAGDYFSRYFGMIVTNGKAENIQLKTTDTRAKYLRSLPLHHSQKEIAANLFELHLVPTDDFINAVRAMGTEVEVVSPDWLRNRLLQDAKDLVKKYSKKL
ncbi:MAG: WYL domain-containing protein, partial [Bacteroidales bacterium]|nr:WYL domain-containing protein [Bacteroidales bacterium]